MQFNKDKPDKFHVNLFLLANALKYFIVHAEDYQGHNATNAAIEPRLWKLMTMQKAALNSVIQSKLHNDPLGVRNFVSNN